MLELFGYYLQRGLIDVGFLGAAQIDRFGNINTTVIGDYEHPTTRLPGSGGACEIAINARHVFVIMRQSPRSFVERIDFRTSPGNLGGAEHAERIRREQGWMGRGPTVVVTDLGIYHFDDERPDAPRLAPPGGDPGRGPRRDRLDAGRGRRPGRPPRPRRPRSCASSARSSTRPATTPGRPAPGGEAARSARAGRRPPRLSLSVQGTRTYRCPGSVLAVCTTASSGALTDNRRLCGAAYQSS